MKQLATQTDHEFETERRSVEAIVTKTGSSTLYER
jgi:hypothetical protein